MKIPAVRIVRKAEEAGNGVGVPMTRGLGLVELFKRTIEEVGKDHLAAFAGNLAYKGFFALFSFFAFLLSLLSVFRASDLIDAVLARAAALIPRPAVAFIQGQVLGVAQHKEVSSAAAVGAVSILLALWGVSGAFRSVMEAMNVMHEVEEERPVWKRYLISVLLSLGVAVLLLAALGLVVFGTDLAGAVADVGGLGYAFERAWAIVQWPVLLFFVAFAFALIYYYAPDVEQRFKWISPGSILAVVLWTVFSVLFSFYVDSFGSYDRVYGSLAGIVILMLYTYYTSFIVLVGAEMNQVVEEHVPEGKDEGEKVPDA